MRMDMNTFGIGCSPFRLTAARASAWLKAQRAAAARQALPPQQHYFGVTKEDSFRQQCFSVAFLLLSPCRFLCFP